MPLDRSAGLIDTARALAAGEVTSRALVEQALARIEATQSTLNTFRIVRTAPRSPKPTRPTGSWPPACASPCSGCRWP